MGRRGPLPAKGLQRRKSRQKAIDAATTVGQVEVDVEAPYDPDPNWHPIALAFYESMERSGQAELYTESDWAKAYLLAEQMSRELKPVFVGFAEDKRVETVNGREVLVDYQKPVSGVQPMKGASLNALQSMMASLGISEGDRRRMGLELVRAKAESTVDPVAQAMKELREAMQSGKVVDIQKNQASGE